MNKGEDQANVIDVKKNLHQSINVIKKNMNMVSGEEKEEEFVEVEEGEGDINAIMT